MGSGGSAPASEIAAEFFSFILSLSQTNKINMIYHISRNCWKRFYKKSFKIAIKILNSGDGGLLCDFSVFWQRSVCGHPCTAWLMNVIWYHGIRATVRSVYMSAQTIPSIWPAVHRAIAPRPAFHNPAVRTLCQILAPGIQGPDPWAFLKTQSLLLRCAPRGF